MLPASIKKGIASKLKLSMPVTIFWPAVMLATLKGSIVYMMMRDDIAMAIAIGTLKITMNRNRHRSHTPTDKSIVLIL
jgi:hypothetical protein